MKTAVIRKRKSFNFEEGIISQAEIRATIEKRSLTKYIEMLIERDLANSNDDFFTHMDARHKGL